MLFLFFTIIAPVYANDIDNSNYIQNASIGNITFDDDFDLDTISEVLGPFDSVEKTITDTGFIEKTYYFERGTVDVEGPYNLCFHLNKSGYVKAISYFVDGL